MKIPLLIEMRPLINKKGPEVFLPQGEWELSSNTDKFFVTTQSLTLKDEEQMLVGSPVLLLTSPSVVQVTFTGVDVERASIYASRVTNGIKPS